MFHGFGGALPARFRRQRVLIVGCGDVGLRSARLLSGRVRLLALTSSPQREANATIVFVVCDRGDRYLSTGVFPA